MESFYNMSQYALCIFRVECTKHNVQLLCWCSRCIRPIDDIQQAEQVILPIVCALNAKFAINYNWLHWSIYLTHIHSARMHNWIWIWIWLIFNVYRSALCCGVYLLVFLFLGLCIARNYHHVDLQVIKIIELNFSLFLSSIPPITIQIKDNNIRLTAMILHRNVHSIQNVFIVLNLAITLNRSLLKIVGNCKRSRIFIRLKLCNPWFALPKQRILCWNYQNNLNINLEVLEIVMFIILWNCC